MALSDPTVATLLNERFVPVAFSMWLHGPRVDPHGRDFVFRDGFYPYPGLILTDADLNVIVRTRSDEDADSTVRILLSALRKRPDLAPFGTSAPQVLDANDPAQAAFAQLQTQYNRTPPPQRPRLVAPLQLWLAEHAETLPDVAAIARILLADCQYAAGEFREAEALWHEVLDLHPNHPMQHRASFNLKDRLAWVEKIHPELEGLPIPGVAIHPPEVPFPELRAANLQALAEDPRFIRAPNGHLFVEIPAGTFTMGGVSEPVVHRNERPLRQVTISKPYLMGATQVTREQWQKFRPETWPGVESEGLAGELPHVRVTWSEAVAYCEWLTSHGDGWRYRLATEAEWERAARGGLEGKRYPWGDDPWDERRANTTLPRPVPVASYPPNGYGVFDMLGNGLQYCSDRFLANAYTLTPADVTDPAGPTAEQQPNAMKVVRGSVIGHEFGRMLAFISWRGPANPERKVGGFSFRIVAERP